MIRVVVLLMIITSVNTSIVTLKASTLLKTPPPPDSQSQPQSPVPISTQNPAYKTTPTIVNNNGVKSHSTIVTHTIRLLVTTFQWCWERANSIEGILFFSLLLLGLLTMIISSHPPAPPISAPLPHRPVVTIPPLDSHPSMNTTSVDTNTLRQRKKKKKDINRFFNNNNGGGGKSPPSPATSPRDIQAHRQFRAIMNTSINADDFTILEEDHEDEEEDEEEEDDDELIRREAQTLSRLAQFSSSSWPSQQSSSSLSSVPLTSPPSTPKY